MLPIKVCRSSVTIALQRSQMPLSKLYIHVCKHVLLKWAKFSQNLNGCVRKKKLSTMDDVVVQHRMCMSHF